MRRLPLAAALALLLLAPTGALAAIAPSPTTATGVVAVAVASSSVKDVATYPDGSQLIGGDYDGVVKFGGTVLPNAGLSNIFVAKVNPDGSYAWAVGASASSNDLTLDAVAVLPDGSAVAVGRVRGTATFGGTTLSSSVNDVFIAYISASGAFTGAIQGTVMGGAEASDVAALADGSILVTGDFTRDLHFASDPAISVTSSLWGTSDAFVLKLSPTRRVNWLVRAGGKDSSDVPNAIAALPDGSSIIAGQYNQATVIGATSFPWLGMIDAFAAKLSPSGAIQWAVNGGGNWLDMFTGVIVQPDGSAIVTGYMSTTATYGPLSATSAGEADGMVAEISADGTYRWVRTIGSTGGDTAFDAAVLGDGTIAVAGDVSTATQFAGAPLGVAGTDSGYLVRLTGNGAPLTGTTFGERGVAIALRSPTSVAVGGSFIGSVTFGGVTLTAATPAARAGFVASFDAPVVTAEAAAQAESADAATASAPTTFTMSARYVAGRRRGRVIAHVRAPAAGTIRLSVKG
ncbi:MAG: hypothetical protein ACR2JV_07080, partial [Gaiellales bacterium]